MIAALFVQTGGAYFGLPDVEPWDEKRDARRYDGPYPVVAHPPCARWGRYWFGGPSARVRRELGDDGGCFASALASVRRWGGVLEHPEASHAWRVHGLIRPPRGGGWVVADEHGGWTCCVEQGHYGHRARKATWLYAFGVELPSLRWGPSAAGARLDVGFHSAEERRAFKSNRSLSPELTARKRHYLNALEAATGGKAFRRLGARERSATPPAFRDVLLSMARSVRRSEAA